MQNNKPDEPFLERFNYPPQDSSNQVNQMPNNMPPMNYSPQTQQSYQPMSAPQYNQQPYQPSTNNFPQYYPSQGLVMQQQVQPIVQQHIIVHHALPLLPAEGYRDETVVTCPSCQKIGPTEVSHKSGSGTNVLALILCIFCCPLVCCPFCCDNCQDSYHHCGNCNAFVGRSKFELC